MKVQVEKDGTAALAYLYFTERFSLAVGWMLDYSGVVLPLAVLVVTSAKKMTRGFELHAWRLRVGFCVPIMDGKRVDSGIWSFPKPNKRKGHDDER